MVCILRQDLCPQHLCQDMLVEFKFLQGCDVLIMRLAGRCGSAEACLRHCCALCSVGV
jgi:hypothetical protein